MDRLRLRDLGVQIGELPTGEKNAITDVPGVMVGQTTLIEGQGKLKPGQGPLRTGVTVVLLGKFLSPPQKGMADSRSRPDPPDQGSIMIILATDAPLESRQLERLCLRAAAGLARTGSHYGHGSGDFVIAFSTTRHMSHKPGSLVQSQNSLVDEARGMSGLFTAVVESVE